MNASAAGDAASFPSQGLPPPPGSAPGSASRALVPSGLSMPGAYRPPMTDLAPITATPSTRGAARPSGLFAVPL